MIYHVHTHVEGGWVARREGSMRAARRFYTRGQALRYTRGLKGWTEIVLHRTDGTVLGLQHRKPVAVAPPKLKRETLAGRMVKRFRREALNV